MVVGGARDRAGLDVGGQDDGADNAAAGPGPPRLDAVGQVIWPGRLAAARRRVALCLVKGDDQQSALLIGRRGGDDGNPLLQERIGGGEPASLPIQTRRIVTVVAEAGRDEHIVRGGRDALQVGRQMAGANGSVTVEGDDIGVALGGVIDHVVEVHERIVARGVLIARGLGLGVVGTADRRVAARR